MRRGAQFWLYATRILGICAVLAGVAFGLLEATLGAGFACFDVCPSPVAYFTNLGPGTAKGLAPCVVLATLAVGVFVAYCAATGQRNRMVIALLFFLLAGIAGVGALSALMWHAQATLPVNDALLAEDPLVLWQREWGWSIVAIAGVWSGALTYLEWKA